MKASLRISSVILKSAANNPTPLLDPAIPHVFGRGRVDVAKLYRIENLHRTLEQEERRRIADSRLAIIAPLVLLHAEGKVLFYEHHPQHAHGLHNAWTLPAAHLPPTPERNTLADAREALRTDTGIDLPEQAFTLKAQGWQWLDVEETSHMRIDFITAAWPGTIDSLPDNPLHESVIRRAWFAWDEMPLRVINTPIRTVVKDIAFTLSSPR